MGADAAIAAIAARQHGAVGRAQLVAAGVSAEAIKHRVATGRLTALHRGVYSVGPTHTPLTSLMAATLACGSTAVLSHHAAAALHGIRPARGGPIEVTVTKGHARKRRGLRIHRARAVERTTVHGIPVTTVARTLRDLAGDLNERELGRAVEEAQIQRKLDHLSLVDAVDEARGRRGARALRAAAQHEARLTRSEAERRVLELVRAAELPAPRTNARLGRYEVDFVWPTDRLVVEVDGYAYHSTREAFERDRRKDADLLGAGYRVLRVTWRQIAKEPEAVVARLARSLSAVPAPARPPAAAAPRGCPPDRRRW